jgi:hypothetical protein
MSQPLVFISRNRIKKGRVDEFRKFYEESLSPIMADKPGTLAQLAYLSGDTAEFTIIRVFPNADALDHQLMGADERSKKTYEYIDPIGIEIFGTLNDATLDRMKQITGSGVVVIINPRYLGGFIR